MELKCDKNPKKQESTKIKRVTVKYDITTSNGLQSLHQATDQLAVDLKAINCSTTTVTEAYVNGIIAIIQILKPHFSVIPVVYNLDNWSGEYTREPLVYK